MVVIDLLRYTKKETIMLVEKPFQTNVGIPKRSGELYARPKMFWLARIIIVLLLLGILIVVAEGTAVAPFVYTLF